jgi:hypothetical protein
MQLVKPSPTPPPPHDQREIKIKSISTLMESANRPFGAGWGGGGGGMWNTVPYTVIQLFRCGSADDRTCHRSSGFRVVSYSVCIIRNSARFSRLSSFGRRELQPDKKKREI